jgi:hypothetical protein
MINLRGVLDIIRCSLLWQIGTHFLKEHAVTIIMVEP